MINDGSSAEFVITISSIIIVFHDYFAFSQIT